MDVVRILIADDHPLFRDGLRLLLDSVQDMEVVGEAGSGNEAVALTESLQPDIVVMDLNMPGINGIEATSRIISTSPHVGILVITMYDDDDSVFTAMKAGARGYLLKGANQAETIRAIRAVNNGEAIFSPSIAQRMIRYFSTVNASYPQTAFPELTVRELGILELIASGHSNGEISIKLDIRPKTVRNHVSNIFNKLQVVDRSQAIIRAREAGMGKNE